jgi:hypothetical protein
VSTVAENYEYRGFELKEITGVSDEKQDGYPSLSGVWQNSPRGWNDADLEMIDLSIGHLMKSIGIKGASLALVKDEKLIFAKGFGEMNDKGEFVKNNYVKRHQEFANLILFQIKVKDGN